MLIDWLADNYIEVLGAIAGIVYIFLEIRVNIWLWPVGIITSAAYVWVFFNGKLYADMSLQVYYIIISIFGWVWWVKGTSRNNEKLQITDLKMKTGILLALIFIVLFAAIWATLRYCTDSPVPVWDAFITSLSAIATWMLARKILQHWLLWIVVNIAAIALFITRGLYPTAFLYVIYGIMAFVGLKEWTRTMEKLKLNENEL
jgi:nicotinamide mononucleotide transporter